MSSTSMPSESLNLEDCLKRIEGDRIISKNDLSKSDYARTGEPFQLEIVSL